MIKFGRSTRKHMAGELAAFLKESDAVIVTNFQGIGVNKIENLRKLLRASSARFKIVKNSMARVAAKDAGLDFLVPLFEGTCSVGFCSEDAFLKASKIFVNFSKENEKFKICGGALTGEFIQDDKIKEFAMLPSREILLAMAASGIKSPISGFVGVLNNVVTGFIRVIDKIGKQKGGGI